MTEAQRQAGGDWEWLMVNELQGSNLAVDVIRVWLVFIWHIIHIRHCFPIPHATLDLPLPSLFRRQGTTVIGTIWLSLLAWVRLSDYCQTAWTRVFTLPRSLVYLPLLLFHTQHICHCLSINKLEGWWIRICKHIHKFYGFPSPVKHYRINTFRCMNGSHYKLLGLFCSLLLLTQEKCGLNNPLQFFFLIFLPWKSIAPAVWSFPLCSFIWLRVMPTMYFLPFHCCSTA